MSDAGQKGTKAAIRRWCRNSWAWARDYPDAIGASPPVGPISESDRTLALAAYSELSSRRASYDTLMWQVPAFVATVQGVLLGFVLKTNQQSAQRWVMLVVAAWIAFVGLQTMRKHRYFHTVDAELMANLERRMGMRNATGIVIHGSGDDRTRQARGVVPNAGRFTEISSHGLWFRTIQATFIADLLILAYSRL
jgi:hypothetical protein